MHSSDQSRERRTISSIYFLHSSGETLSALQSHWESGLLCVRCVSEHAWKSSSQTQPKIGGMKRNLAPSIEGEDLHKSLQAHREPTQGDSILSIFIQ